MLRRAFARNGNLCAGFVPARLRGYPLFAAFPTVRSQPNNKNRRMLQRLAHLILRIGGWSIIGETPNVPKAVVIAAPHTSNWDGVWALTYKVAVKLDVKFFAKESLFWFPLSTLLRGLGGIPLDRSQAGSAVRQAVSMFEEKDRFYFGLAPEGTRSLKKGWKTGFHRIASAARVPVYFGVIDYVEKHIGITGRMETSDDIEADLEKCAEFYAETTGRHPDKASPIRSQ